MKLFNFLLVALAALPTSTFALFTPDADGGSISLEDEATRITGLSTIFTGDTTLVTLDGIEWSPSEDVTNTTSTLMWETSVNGVVMDSGSMEVPTDAFDLPTSISAGSIVVDKSKWHYY